MTASTLSGSELRDGWSKWLREVFLAEPILLATLTFATRPWESAGIPGISRVQRAGRKFERLLIRSLARPSYFVVMEAGAWNGRRHLHSLISCTDKAVIREGLERHREREGFVKLSVRAGCVEEYVTKYLSKSDQDFWLAGGPLYDLHGRSVVVGTRRYIDGSGGRSVGEGVD